MDKQDLNIIALPIPVEDNPSLDSRFRLVIAASQVARRLNKRIGVPLVHKVTTQAIINTIVGDVKFLKGDAAALAMETKRQKEQMSQNKMFPMIEDDVASKVRKDLDSYLSQVAEVKPVEEPHVIEEDEDFTPDEEESDEDDY